MNDLVLYQRLLQYKLMDKEIAAAALQVIWRHLWYLLPQTAVFTLFSLSIDTSVKNEMAQKLSAVAAPQPYTIANVLVDKDTHLPDLIDEQSRGCSSRSSGDMTLRGSICRPASGVMIPITAS